MEELFGLSMNVLMMVVLAIFLATMVVLITLAWRNRIMLKMGLRPIPRRLGQTVLIIVGVMLSTVIISAAFGTGDTISFSIRSQVLEELKTIDELIIPARAKADDSFGSAPYVPYQRFKDLQAELAGFEEIDGLAPQIGESVPAVNLRTSQSEGSMRVAGIAPDLLEGFGTFTLTSGEDVRLEDLRDGEAYINEAKAGAMETAVPLAMEFENVFITRSFSKAHGLAGLRIGYALGQEQTLAKIRDAWGMGDVNMLGAIAALTALEDKEHIAWEAQENAEIRDMVVGAFREMGFEVGDSHTNHIFVNLRRPAREFREACLQHKILVGRDFPPMEQTHCRISLGSREQMETAVEVFRKVLA